MTAEVATTGPVTSITLRWERQRNALGPDEADELADAIRRGATTGASALVLRGEGAFCAGGHLPAIAALVRDYPDDLREVVYRRYQGVVRALHACPVPTIAAVDGAAIGLGMDIALACDMRIVGDGGWMRQGWAAAGLITGTGGVALLERLAPGTSWRLLCTQERLDAAACAALGIGEATEGSAFDAATQRAEELARLPRATIVGYVKLHRSLRWPDDHFFDQCAQIQADLLRSPEFAAVAARMA